MHAFENTTCRGKHHPKKLKGSVPSAHIMLKTVNLPKTHKGKFHNSWLFVRILKRGLLQKLGIISPRLNAVLVPPNIF